MKISRVLLLSLGLFAACAQQYDHKGKTPLVEVAGQFLYQEDLSAVTPFGLSSDDSLLYVEHYIREWVEDALLFEKAKKNIPDNDRIENLVNNYRKALITHAYQQNLIEQKLTDVLTDEEMLAYYEANKSLFMVEHPIIRGVFLKIPLKSPNVSQVRQWFVKDISENRDKLEKYSFQHAVGYEYFFDRWVPAVEITNQMPVGVDDISAFLEKKKFIELKDSANYYFLHVEQLLLPGQEEPFEFARAEVKDILSNQKRISFMKQVKRELYDDAAKRNRIIYYENR